MDFIHRDQEFDELLRIVAEDSGLALGLVEKDYWVTHALWALADQGFEIWLKGGTSLSKGFHLITRFSEDLDLKLEPGLVTELPPVANWKSDGKKATENRKTHFEALGQLLFVPDTQISVQDNGANRWHGAEVHVEYPGKHLAALGPLRPYVLLEFGSARISPHVECRVTSFVHDYLDAQKLLDSYVDNRPEVIRCLHPLVTLLEKLDALQRRAPRSDREPSAFVRHYEDAARIILKAVELPELTDYRDVRSLTDEMVAERQIRELPSPTDTAFVPDATERWDAIRAAYEDIAPMFWGKRIPLEESCALIRDWLSSELH